MTTFDDYCAELPLLHTWDGGKTMQTGGFNERHLRAFFELARGETGGASILETGAGNSTLTFLFSRPARLISIAPDAELFARIRAWSAANDLDTDPLQAVVGRSEVALPGIAWEQQRPGGTLDLALLDGGHGWPTVFVDFCYANALLKRGGIVLIDDVQLHSVKELARLLVQQPEFRLVHDLGKVLAFEKLVDAPFLGDFRGQPYLAEQNRRIEQSGDPFAL